MNNRCSFHNHTYYSNLRLLDALSSPEALIDKAIELGINYLGITEHESISSHVRINKYTQELQKQGKKIHTILGNEIYLVDNREENQKYYHHILLAKDSLGHKMLRELSSIAWINSYQGRGMLRVPTLKQELQDIVTKYGKGHLISSTACIGSELGQNILAMREAEFLDDYAARKKAHDAIVDYALFNEELFGDDFYFEIAPAEYEEQIYVNNKIVEIAKVFGHKITVQDDSHRVSQDDYIAHQAFLNSKQGEREDIDKFYRYTYLQSYEDIRTHLSKVEVDCDELFANSIEIAKKCEDYSLFNKQQVVQIAVKDYPKQESKLDKEKYPTLDYLYKSDNIQERNWVNQCIDKLKEKKLFKKEYLDELEYEADIQKTIGEKLDTCIFAYPLFLQHYIDLFWECGSPVGVARGSGAAGLNHYLLGITQLDSLKEDFKYWRFLNKERVELPDIDIDIAPDKKELIFQKIREERGEFGIVQVCTFGTLSSKSAVLNACRGYRSEEYPMGIDNDEAQYLSSLIGQERGFVWSVRDTVFGNEKKGRKPVKAFVDTINKYPGLLDIILKIEGCISQRGCHASAVLFLEPGHEYDRGAFMKSPDGTLTTQYDLYSAEWTGMVKYDFLYTDVESKIAQCIELLQDYGKIEKDLSLREAYNKYLHPDVLPVKDDKLWDAIDKADIISLFQLTSQVGSQTVKRLRPRSIDTLNDVNGIIRLMSDGNGETPTDRYVRLQNNPQEWEQEMDSYGLTSDEKKIIHEYINCGVLIDQETLMQILMDERVCNFSLAESNSARKVVAKKHMNEIESLHQKVLEKAASSAMGQYIWFLLAPSMGYSFSSIHGKSYSYIAAQCADLATYYPVIYWDTACLRVEGGVTDDGTTDYEKVAKALGEIKDQQGIIITAIDINKSGQLFLPDEKNNTIIYGMKCLSGVNANTAKEIIEHRPYSSMQDLQNKVNLNRTAMISLIKGGAFDNFSSREDAMVEYLREVSKPKKRITLQNLKGIIDANLLPEEFNFHKRLFVFNQKLKEHCKISDMYAVNGNYYDFYEQFFDINLLEPIGEEGLGIKQKEWEKLYKKKMDEVSKYFKANQKEILKKYNDYLFQEQWDAYGQEGNLSAWEMKALGAYATTPHELAMVKNNLYNIVEFKDLSTTPIVDYTFKKGDREIPIFKTQRIAGTVIGKDARKHIVTLLTPNSGVVEVKFTKDYFAKYNQQLSEIQSDGKKKVVEKSWFNRGVLVMVNGFRREGMFVAKSYKRTNSHQLYKITKVNDNGTIEMTNKRYGEE